MEPHLLEALREETLPKLQPVRASLERARASGNAAELEAARELMHKVAGTAALAGLASLSRLARVGEDVALLAIEGEARLTKRLFAALDAVLSAIAIELEPPTAVKVPAQEPPSEPQEQRGRVVVASDEAVTSKLLVKLLTAQGFAPRKLSLADAADRLPDCELLLLDLPAAAVPNASIEDALANANKYHVPVVITARGNQADAFAARAATVLTKPVPPDALENAVRVHVERRLKVAAARARAPTGQVPKPTQPERPLRVLVVDDSRVIRGVVREALAEAGVTAVEAHDGTEALRAFELQRPDAVISDLQMPGVDGAQLIPLLRQRTAEGRVPIVVLTSLEDQATRSAVLSAGADAYLVKSVIDGPALMRALKAAGLPL